jgi:hypothetical protein
MNLEAMTAFGMTETLFKSDGIFTQQYRISTKQHRNEGAFSGFRYLVCDTQTTWSISERVNFRNLFMTILLGSENPKREWSVKQVLRPMVRAWMMASWHMEEKAWCP